MLPRFVLCLTLLSCTAAVAPSQTPLPTELEAIFGGFGPFATSFKYAGLSGSNQVQARVEFDNLRDEDSNPNYSVTINWRSKIGSGGWQSLDQEVKTTFQPTAVTRRNGSTKAIYVAGWFEDTNEVVVEKWKFTASLVEVPPVGGSGQQDLAFPEPALTRTVLLRCSSVQPLSSLVCNPYANQLWLLEWPLFFPKRLLSLDLSLSAPQCSDLVLLYDDSNPAHKAIYPGLSKYTSIYAGTHPTAGWIVYFEERRPWVSGAHYEEPYPMLTGFDFDLDGVIDSLRTVTYGTLYTAYPYSTWNDVF